MSTDHTMQIQNIVSFRKYDLTLIPSCSATAAVQSKIGGNIFTCRQFNSTL